MPPVIAGPAWSVRADSPDDRGRFPLGVEAVTLAHAAALAPGVTAGTTHGRYYALHARIAAEVARSSTAGKTMSLATARDLIRGSEVILGAISVRHFESAPDQHQALSQPHAEAVLGPALTRAGSNGSLQIADLAKTYSRQVSGFHTVYRGAEIVLGLIQQPQLPQCQRSFELPRWRSGDLPGGGHGLSPWTDTRSPQLIYVVSGVTPLPAVA